jgi:hypothetical protein
MGVWSPRGASSREAKAAAAIGRLAAVYVLHATKSFQSLKPIFLQLETTEVLRKGKIT